MTAVPYVRAALSIPSMNRHVIASFLIDTGADATVIHPQDSLRLFTLAEIGAMSNATQFGGAGGGKPHYPIEAEITFLHDDQATLQTVQLPVYIAKPPHNLNVESLLGRDVLDSFVMTFDQSKQKVTLD